MLVWIRNRTRPLRRLRQGEIECFDLDAEPSNVAELRRELQTSGCKPCATAVCENDLMERVSASSPNCD